MTGYTYQCLCRHRSVAWALQLRSYLVPRLEWCCTPSGSYGEAAELGLVRGRTLGRLWDVLADWVMHDSGFGSSLQSCKITKNIVNVLSIFFVVEYIMVPKRTTSNIASLCADAAMLNRCPHINPTEVRIPPNISNYIVALATSI